MSTTAGINRVITTVTHINTIYTRPNTLCSGVPFLVASRQVPIRNAGMIVAKCK